MTYAMDELLPSSSPPANSHVEALTPQNVTVFGNGIFKVQLHSNEFIMVGPNPLCPYKKRIFGQTDIEGKPMVQ